MQYPAKNNSFLPLTKQRLSLNLPLTGMCSAFKINPIKFISRSKLFDADWYIDTNPDVKASGVDPAFHFYTRGWLEGRSPSLFFNMKEYLSEFHPTKCPLLYTDEKYKAQEVFFVDVL